MATKKTTSTTAAATAAGPVKGDTVVNKTPTAADRKNAAAQYGWSLAILNSSPDLKKLFNNAVTYGYSPARFVAELQDTNWFKTQSAQQREADIQKTVDSKTYQDQFNTQKSDLGAIAQSMGAVLTDAQLTKMTNDSQALGWDQTQQKNALASYVTLALSGPNKGQYLGAAGQNQQALLATAQANGYTLSDSDMAKWQQSIASGQQTVADYQQFMRRQAALSYPSFSDELLAGNDLKDVANPYINSMSNILEIPANQISLQDQTLKKGLAQTNPQTGKPTALSMPDFENMLRQDPRWQYTDNAKQSAANTVLNIGKIMGVA
jgi:hypothetical protein